ncbi:M3 family oligoendopeptidase [Cytophagales bacterium LB-30]|uniref:M3 family oligoendopeptidase n=1 Tax=Shiella aurantiaca TaxID=3058365 RepID=A0ABT8F8K1_9BACT|nr:M3 family oligoendopeptidase [Shiella aurantiaca]MDN4166574.1 M3 family oligoendopeptidase [Shiella aurantiaca]
MIQEIKPAPRHFLDQGFTVKEWSQIEPYFQQLLVRNLDSVEALKQWFKDRSELESVLSEDMAWRYIRMTCDTTDDKIREAFEFFVSEIEPKIAPLANELNKKALESPHLGALRKEIGYDIMIRSMEKDFKNFREKNIPIQTEIQKESQRFGAISGAMSVTIAGKEFTLQQAAVLLQETDRAKREKVYRQIADRRLQDKDTLNELYTKLIQLRHQVAVNADYENFRDYMFSAMGRFDYSPTDCFDFHISVEVEVVPFLHEFAQRRKETLGVDALRPWDKAVDPEGKQPLKPFDGGKDLTSKTIECFNRLDPFLGDCLKTMEKMGHLDLESRKGKAPGGYNYPLAETGVPFIFMNATSTVRDMVTILHEGGHAVHSFLTRDMELNDFKNTPSEVAELASMSMELLSMDHWDVYFSNPEELKRAKKEHLEQIIETLPWVAAIDKFQHWIYENPEHGLHERLFIWNEIHDAFSDEVTDWSGLEEQKKHVWQKQLHLFEVPFYYIEYGMAQLGAIAVWKNFKEDPKKGLEGYMNALKLGYTRSIPEVYAAANIKFDFSREYIKELMDFVKQELDALN